jgi:hypothetical protein
MAFPRRLIPLFGSGRTIDVIGAIQRAITNRRGQSRSDIDIINRSLGHPLVKSAATDPRVPAVDRAAASGVIAVASASKLGTNPNTGDIKYAGTTSPGNAPSAITAGAYDHKASASPLDDAVGADKARRPIDTETNWAPTLTRCPDVQFREMDATLTCSISVDGPQFATAHHLTGGDIFVGQHCVGQHGPLQSADLAPAAPAATGAHSANRQHRWSDDIVRANQPELNCDNIVWGNTIVVGQNIVVGENIVWDENPAWGQSLDDNTARGSWDDIVWGNDGNFVREHGAVAADAKNGRAQR